MIKLEKYTGEKTYLFLNGGIGNKEAVIIPSAEERIAAVLEYQTMMSM